MRNVQRLLMVAAVFNMIVAASASAQTVLVKGATAGETVEVYVNGTKGASGLVGPDGQVRVSGTIPPNDAKRQEMDSRVYVDTCGEIHRVHIVNRNLSVPTREDTCERREITGIFWIRQRSTLVIDVAGPIPTLLLRQGSYDPTAALRLRRESPIGLVLFGGGGWGTFNDVAPSGCGTVQDCVGENSGGGYTVGAAYWPTKFLAGEVTFLKPAKADYRGGGTGFDFTHALEADVLTVSGILAAPLGPVRLYGKAGGSYHEAVSSTTQIHEDTTITVGDVTTTIPGGTQTFAVETEGWGWLFGGGFEGWVRPRLALYGEFGLAKVKGPAVSGTDLDLDERVSYFVFGTRFKLF